MSGNVRTSRAATSAQIRSFAASKNASAGVFDGQLYGRAQVGIDATLMNALVDGMLLNQDRKTGKIGTAVWDSERARLLAVYNSYDVRIMQGFVPQARQLSSNGVVSGSAVRSHRPLAYVPKLNVKTMKVEVPNQFAINHRVRKGNSSKWPLIPLFGAKHMHMLGFPVRDRLPGRTGKKSKIDWTPGNMRVVRFVPRAGGGNRVSLKAFGWYRSAAGKLVPVTAATTSRLAQLVVNSNGSLRAYGVPDFIPNGNFAGGTRGFLSPNAGARGLSEGEIVYKVSAGKGPRFAFRKPRAGMVGSRVSGGQSRRTRFSPALSPLPSLQTPPGFAALSPSSSPQPFVSRKRVRVEDGPVDIVVEQ